MEDTMSPAESQITRRDFMRGTACATIALAMGIRAEGQQAKDAAKLTRVVLVRDAAVFDAAGRIDEKVIQKMLDDGVTALFQKTQPLDAWKMIVRPRDIVGIKTNQWEQLPTPPEVEQSIRRRVIEAGVPEENIAVEDRSVLRNEVFRTATALINTRPLRTHAWSGVGGCLKNYIMFSPKPSDYHDNTCANLALLWTLPIVKDKTRLNVLVMLEPLFNGEGRHYFDKTYTWKYNGLLIGTDPVALDATGLRIFQAKRLAYFGEDRPMTPPPHHIAFAETKHHLGVADAAKIDLIKLGWKEGVLI